MTSFGVFIHSRNTRAPMTPTTARITPLTTETSMDVCTDSSMAL